jgi:hypothetical protein
LEIAGSKRKARNICKKTIQENDIKNLDAVQAAFTERDQKQAELKPIIAGLEEKLKDAEEILKKYG